MSSLRFSKLEEGLRRVRGIFLPAVRDVTGANYTDVDVGRAAGYIAIAHAEIQHYFDDRVRELAIKAIHEFSAKDLVSREIVGLLTYCGMKDKELTLDAQQAVSDELTAHVKHPTTSIAFCSTSISVIKRAGEFYEKEFRQKNNGIKTKNLIKLLLPLGFSPQALNQKWLAKMDSLGVNRGNSVHKSLGSTIIGDPFSFSDDIEKALHGDAG
jgi:hypothetical protein